jgi:CheY-like chemotaxis protein
MFFTELARQKNVEFLMEVDDSVPTAIVSDKTRFAQIAINLASNALKFTPPGRRVNMRVLTEVDCCAKLHEDIPHQQVIAVQVVDEGIGIAKENISKLFRPFFQVEKNSIEGSGLGLYICRELAHLMKGHICCKSQLAQGSTFTFVSPCEPANLPIPDASALAPPPIALEMMGKYKVLVAEDNKVNQLVISNMLRKIGCSFDIADNGKIACELFEQGEYFLVLMDLMMPVMDGFEATQRISSSIKFALKRPMIVAVTASVSEHEIKQARSCGCVDVLSKPVNVDRLRVAMSAAAQHFARNRTRYALPSSLWAK